MSKATSERTNKPTFAGMGKVVKATAVDVIDAEAIAALTVKVDGFMASEIDLLERTQKAVDAAREAIARGETDKARFSLQIISETLAEHRAALEKQMQ